LTIILTPDERREGQLLRYWQILRNGIASTPGSKWWERINDSAVDVLKTSAIIDLQWSQSILLAPLLRSKYPGKPIVGTAHDILGQSLDRALDSSHLKTRIRARLTRHRVRRNEVAAMKACDLLYVFKSDDQASLLDYGVSTRVRTTPPYTSFPDAAPSPDPQSQLIVFTGAFWRSENSEGAQWFIEHVWPNVTQECPAARVRFAGSRPPEWLMNMASEKVEVTGYLPDLNDSYRGAAMVIAPLVRGAGLKFKVVQAIVLGYPVVGTSVAAEGINSLLGCDAVDVNDDPIDFSRAVIATLRDLDARIDQSRVTMNIARGQLDFPRHIQQQIRDYNNLITQLP